MMVQKHGFCPLEGVLLQIGGQLRHGAGLRHEFQLFFTVENGFFDGQQIFAPIFHAFHFQHPQVSPQFQNLVQVMAEQIHKRIPPENNAQNLSQHFQPDISVFPVGKLVKENIPVFLFLVLCRRKQHRRAKKARNHGSQKQIALYNAVISPHSHAICGPLGCRDNFLAVRFHITVNHPEMFRQFYNAISTLNHHSGNPHRQNNIGNGDYTQKDGG